VTRPVTNIGASIRARLSNIARERGVDFQRILQRYAIERLLARLSVSAYRDQFVLKGAMLYFVWGGGAERPTRDLDLLGYGPASPEEVQKRFAEICAIEHRDDGIAFDLATLTAEAIREDAAYGGVRIRIEARVEQARVHVQVDVAHGEVVVPVPDEIEFPPLLAAIGPRLHAYPHEVVMAEKFHAAVVLGETNSRLKDYYDLYMLPRLFVFDDAALARALAATFTRRATELPTATATALPSSYFSDPARAQTWRAFRERDGLTLAPQDFVEVGEAIRLTFAAPLALALEQIAATPSEGPLS